MKSPEKLSLSAISPETPDFPTILMQKIGEETTAILGTPKILPIGRKNVEKFRVDGWHIYILRGHRGEEVIFFISPVYAGDNQSIHLCKKRKLHGKMMIKLRDNNTGESFIRDRIEKNDFESGFELPETPIISSLPPDGAYYHPMRDGTIDDYITKRQNAGELFFFKTYEEYLQLKREGFISEELVESGTYQIKIIYTAGKADEYYTLTGLLSCEPTNLSRRPGQDNNRSIETVLKAEGVVGWEILGIFPNPST